MLKLSVPQIKGTSVEIRIPQVSRKKLKVKRKMDKIKLLIVDDHSNGPLRTL